MSGESSIKLKLSVWRDFVPSKSLVLRAASGADQQISVDSDIQQEIFCWHMREDPFGGVLDANVRVRLHELLIERFEASKPPSQRHFQAINDFLKEAMTVIDANQAEWTVSQDSPADDEDAPRRLNPLLGLVLHIKWLSESFAGQPGVSVSIR